MAEAAKTSTADVQAEFDALRQDISKLSEAVARLVGESAGDVRDRARASASQAASSAQQAAGAAGSRVTEFVEEKPTTSLLIAFGVGLLCGTFARRS